MSTLNGRRLIPLLIILSLLVLPLSAEAGHTSDPRTKNIHPVGHSERPASFLNAPPDVNSDIAFWGNYAFQGSYSGFRIIDISAPGNPRQISETSCDGNQGDVVVWDNILVRSWNSPAPAGRTCDGQPVPEGFEGVHIFDISNLSDPVLLAAVETVCGSHTATGVPDLANSRLIIYNNVSSGCDWIDIIEVPLDDPSGAALLRVEPLEGPFTPGVSPGCHDMGVILGDRNLAACASADTTNVFDIGENEFPGGSLEDPALLYTIREPGVGDLTQGTGRWHSAAFTWDGEVLVLGWEPGGGAQPRCSATGTLLPGGVTQTDTHKSLFFYDADSGAKLGQWVLPRAQTVQENCTLHNYNIIPRPDRYVLVHGSYQSGTSVVDFTDPAAAVELAFVDPPRLVPTQIGGSWSSYWYNGFIYESDITEGLNVFVFSSSARAREVKLTHLNPQTQEFTIR